MAAASPPIAPSRLAPLLRPVEAFLSAEAAGGIVLMVSAVVAMVWANSPWGDAYAHFWHLTVSLGAGALSRSMSLEHCVNDGLMVLFFLLVGLEIKRELLLGELASFRRAALPVAAAIGGMIVPAAIYAVFNHAGDGAHGWGVPMATDIAFAVGVLALVGKGIPTSVKIFLLAVAIVDDLGAVLVIAIFYTSKVSLLALGVAGIFLALLVLLNLLRVHRPLPYLLLGLGLWAATLASGVHATIAGVLLAFCIPASRPLEERPYVDHVRGALADFDRDATLVPDKITPDQSHTLHSIERASRAVQTPLALLEHALLRPVNFLIIPLFALANAGVDLRSGLASAAASPIAWGILAGLVAGKTLGVLLATWLAVKTKLATLPDGATPRQIAGVAALCGIGFTMSLFVANLAFAGNETHVTEAKLGTLAASVVAGLIGGAILALPAKGTPPKKPNH